MSAIMLSPSPTLLTVKLNSPPVVSEIVTVAGAIASSPVWVASVNVRLRIVPLPSMTYGFCPRYETNGVDRQIKFKSMNNFFEFCWHFILVDSPSISKVVDSLVHDISLVALPRGSKEPKIDKYLPQYREAQFCPR
jgi:hypothetical protein